METFKGGQHIDGFKYLSREMAIKIMPLPSQVIIPLSQHTGAVCEPVVKKGDMVKTGTMIGTSDKLISSRIHASISGVVKDIVEYNHPVLGQSKAVIIDSDGKDTLDSSIVKRTKIEELSKEQLLEIIKNAGIVGLGGAAFPAQVKLNPLKPVDTLLINGVECEPYLTCDYRLMLEHTHSILKGIGLMQKIIGVERVVIGIEEDKQEAIKLLRNKCVEKKYDIEIVCLKAKYPQGAEKQLIKAILDREVPSGKLPFDVGVIVSNVGTAFSLFEAVYNAKPLYERVVTVTGKCLKQPSNLKVRIGTRFKELIDFCQGFKEAPGKIIMGGPMMGISQYTDDVPVIKGTSGILILSQKEVDEYTQGADQPCIRCGRCVNICPVGMLPYALSLCVEMDRLDKAAQYNPFDCIECGTCTYVCPAKRQILSGIRLIKAVTR
ncbi:MAG: electron transport complex subunit RsxC [Candidatus Omnitrophica bacterium]|nr:electron transport complex subunit RsxC [Candidatus Omnitrophota bacterium]